MCIGMPMQVIALGALSAEVWGRGRVETVDLRLVGPCAVGDWLLVFHGAARERLDPQRAAEIGAALDLLEQAMSGELDAERAGDTDPGFALPSTMDAAALAALTGNSTR